MYILRCAALWKGGSAQDTLPLMLRQFNPNSSKQKWWTPGMEREGFKELRGGREGEELAEVSPPSNISFHEGIRCNSGAPRVLVLSAIAESLSLLSHSLTPSLSHRTMKKLGLHGYSHRHPTKPSSESFTPIGRRTQKPGEERLQSATPGDSNHQEPKTDAASKPS